MSQTINNITVVANQAYPLNIQLQSVNPLQSIALNSGWNLMSLNVHPAVMTPRSIFDPVLSHIVQVKDLTNTFDPDLPDQVNTLQNLTDGYAYWVNSDANANLGIIAPAVNPATTVTQLHQGWNLIGYTPQANQALTSALAGISDKIVQVKSLTQSYIPGASPVYNTLTTMEPDKGYWINVNQNCNLSYPNALEQPANNDLRLPATWNPVINPANSATVLGKVKIRNVYAQAGDWVGAFINNSCIGAAPVVIENQQAYVSILVNVSQNDQSVNLRVYKASVDSTFGVETTITLSPGEVAGNPEPFTFNATIVGNSDTTINANRLQVNNYPNPFNPSTTISYYLPTSVPAEATIYNLKGEVVSSINLTNNKQGWNSFVWKGLNQQGTVVSSGIYFCKITAANSSVTRKMLLMK